MQTLANNTYVRNISTAPLPERLRPIDPVVSVIRKFITFIAMATVVAGFITFFNVEFPGGPILMVLGGVFVLIIIVLTGSRVIDEEYEFLQDIRKGVERPLPFHVTYRWCINGQIDDYDLSKMTIIDMEVHDIAPQEYQNQGNHYRVELWSSYCRFVGLFRDAAGRRWAMHFDSAAHAIGPLSSIAEKSASVALIESDDHIYEWLSWYGGSRWKDTAARFIEKSA